MEAELKLEMIKKAVKASIGNCKAFKEISEEYSKGWDDAMRIVLSHYEANSMAELKERSIKNKAL